MSFCLARLNILQNVESAITTRSIGAVCLFPRFKCSLTTTRPLHIPKKKFGTISLLIKSISLSFQTFSIIVFSVVLLSLSALIGQPNTKPMVRSTIKRCKGMANQATSSCLSVYVMLPLASLPIFWGVSIRRKHRACLGPAVCQCLRPKLCPMALWRVSCMYLRVRV